QLDVHPEPLAASSRTPAVSLAIGTTCGSPTFRRLVTTDAEPLGVGVVETTRVSVAGVPALHIGQDEAEQTGDPGQDIGRGTSPFDNCFDERPVSDDEPDRLCHDHNHATDEEQGQADAESDVQRSCAHPSLLWHQTGSTPTAISEPMTRIGRTYQTTGGTNVRAG